MNLQKLSFSFLLFIFLVSFWGRSVSFFPFSFFPFYPAELNGKTALSKRRGEKKELNGNTEKLCTLTDCQCDVKSSMPDGVLCIRSKIACLEHDKKSANSGMKLRWTDNILFLIMLLAQKSFLSTNLSFFLFKRKKKKKKNLFTRGSLEGNPEKATKIQSLAWRQPNA